MAFEYLSSNKMTFVFYVYTRSPNACITRTRTKALPRPKSHFRRQPETSTEHLLLRTDQPHIMNLKLRILGRNRVPQFLRNALTDINVVIAFVLRVS